VTAKARSEGVRSGVLEVVVLRGCSGRMGHQCRNEWPWGESSRLRDAKSLNPRAVALAWIEAVNQKILGRLMRLSGTCIDIISPRGSLRGRGVLRDWLARAGLTLESGRSFVRDGSVVVEQRGVWRSPDTGEVVGVGEVASRFRVEGAHVVAYERFDNLAAALASAGLTGSDETGEPSSFTT